MFLCMLLKSFVMSLQLLKMVVAIFTTGFCNGLFYPLMKVLHVDVFYDCRLHSNYSKNLLRLFLVFLVQEIFLILVYNKCWLMGMHVKCSPLNSGSVNSKILLTQTDDNGTC